jgi:hypothetical protein
VQSEFSNTKFVLFFEIKHIYHMNMSYLESTIPQTTEANMCQKRSELEQGNTELLMDGLPYHLEKAYCNQPHTFYR